MTTKEIQAELKITPDQLRLMIKKSHGGVFDYMGRRFRAEKSGRGNFAPWYFTEIERPPLSVLRNKDVHDMNMEELKREKLINEIRLLRKKEAKEREAIERAATERLSAEYRRQLDRLCDDFSQVVTDAKSRAELRRLIKEMQR